MELGKRNKQKICNLATEKVVFSGRKYLTRTSILQNFFPVLTRYKVKQNNITSILMKSSFDFKTTFKVSYYFIITHKNY